jgi:hypothetical protein
MSEISSRTRSIPYFHEQNGNDPLSLLELIDLTILEKRQPIEIKRRYLFGKNSAFRKHLNKFDS